MTTGWQTRLLAQVCQIRPSKEEARQRLSPKDLVSFVPMEDLGVDQKTFIPKHAKPLSEVAGSYTYFANGDVLLAKITPCFENGKLGIAEGLINGIGFGSSEYFVFRPGPTLDKEWLYYFLCRKTFRVEGAARMSGAVGHKRVSKEFIENYPIPVPPLAEQQRIVAILDDALAAIATARANAEKNLQNAHAIFESELQSTFTQRGPGWVEKPLGELSSISYGFTESATPKKVGPHFLRITDIQHNRVDWATVPYCKIDREDMPRYKLVDGDIVFARTGATTGKSYLVTNPPESVFASYLIRVHLSSEQLAPRFLNLFFQTHSYWGAIRAQLSGSAQGGFNATKLGGLLIPFPKSTEMQEAIVARFASLTEQTQHLGAIYERKLAALEALKKTLLHQAFMGALTSSETADAVEAVA